MNVRVLKHSHVTSIFENYNAVEIQARYVYNLEA